MGINLLTDPNESDKSTSMVLNVNHLAWCLAQCNYLEYEKIAVKSMQILDLLFIPSPESKFSVMRSQ